MYRNIFLFVLTFVFCCCDDPYENYYPTTPQKEELPSPEAKFSLKVTKPLTIDCTNLSSNAVEYLWDFGDGYTSKEESPVYRYTGKGAYKVTLRAFNADGEVSYYSKKVTVEEPTKIIFAGLRYNRVAYDNKYYKFQLKDSGPYSVKTWANSTYTLLSNAVMPYDFIFVTPVVLSNIAKHDYYDIYVYWSDKNGGNGNQVLRQRVYTSTIYAFYPYEITRTSDNGSTQVVLLFDYE